MGYHAAWIWARGTRDDVLAGLQLATVETITEEVYDPGFFAIEIGGGTLAIGDGWDHMELVERADAERISWRHEALYFITDDTTMCAGLVGFRDGREVWALTYDGMNGIGSPTAHGALPPAAADVLARARVQQAADRDADYMYGAIAALGHALTGFRHDETLGSGAPLPIYRVARAP